MKMYQFHQTFRANFGIWINFSLNSNETQNQIHHFWGAESKSVIIFQVRLIWGPKKGPQKGK